MTRKFGMGVETASCVPIDVLVKCPRDALSQHVENTTFPHALVLSGAATLRSLPASCSVAGAPEPLARAGPTRTAAASV